MPGHNSSVFRFSGIEVHERELHILRNVDVLSVEPKAFRVLLHLLRNPGRLVPKDELIKAGWSDTAVTDNSLTRNIALLRRLLGDDPREPRYIETVSTVGYRFVSPVEVEEGAAATTHPEIRESKADEDKAEAVPRSRVSITVAGTGIFAALLCAPGFAASYLLRPLPPPKVTEYTKITRDGHTGYIAGTDGTRIDFNTDPSSSVEQVVSIFGGEVAKVPIVLGHSWLWDVSPDGSHLLVRSLEPSALWSVGALGGEAQFISKVDDTWNFIWSPNGKYIAYGEGQGGLYAMDSDGAGVHKIVTMKGLSDLAWSPDGARIRFTPDDALWEVSSTGGNLHSLFPKWNGPAGQCCGRWTPDGDFFLFLAGGKSTAGPQVGGFEQIWAFDQRHRFLRRASSDPVQLTSGPIHWEMPIPSKDSKKIFARGTIPRGELDRFDPKLKMLQPFLGGISAEFVSFAKDGSQVAYVSYPEGILWRAKPDGNQDSATHRASPVCVLDKLVTGWNPDPVHGATECIPCWHLHSGRTTGVDRPARRRVGSI